MAVIYTRSAANKRKKLQTFPCHSFVTVVTLWQHRYDVPVAGLPIPPAPRSLGRRSGVTSGSVTPLPADPVVAKRTVWSATTPNRWPMLLDGSGWDSDGNSARLPRFSSGARL